MAIIIVKLGECRNVSSVNWCSCVNVYVRLSVWEWDCVCVRPHCHVLWPSIRCPFSARATIHHHDDPLWNPIIPLKLERNRESTNLGCIPRIKRAWWENHVRYSNQCCCIPFELQGSERTKSACQLDTSLLIFEKPRPNLFVTNPYLPLFQMEVISQCGHWRQRGLSALRSAWAACVQACSRRSVVIPHNKLELAIGQIRFFRLGLWQGCLHPKRYSGIAKNKSRVLLLRQISYYH